MTDANMADTDMTTTDETSADRSIVDTAKCSSLDTDDLHHETKRSKVDVGSLYQIHNFCE